MFINEIYKWFIKQKVLLIILILLFVRIVLMYVGGYDSHYMIDENEKYYLEYMQQYEGEITDEKSDKIEAEYRKINLSDRELLVSEQKEKAFQVIYHQYKYEKEKGGGYLLDTRGWQSILEHDELDFSLIICIIVIMTALFSDEYETEMEVLLRSCKKGKYKAPVAKIVIGTMTAGIISLIFQGVHILYLLSTVGLSHGSYPLQSLEWFEGTYYNITLIQAVIITVCVRIVGAILLSVFVMLISIILKRKVVSMIISMAIMLLPAIIFNSGSLGYFLPLPLGPLKGTGYLWPSDYEIVYRDSEKIRSCIFQAIRPTTTIGLISIFLLETILISLSNVVLFSKWKPVFHKSWFRLKSMFMVVICALSLYLTGCSEAKVSDDMEIQIEKDDEQNSIDVNSSKLEIDNAENNILYTDEKGNVTYLIRDVFPRKLLINKIFLYKNQCYYLSENDDSNGIYVGKINLNTFEDKLIYDSVDENKENFFGLVEDKREYDEIFDAMENVKWFFVTNEYIYIKRKYHITQININTGKNTMIAENVSDDDIAYENGTLTYKDEKGKEVNIKCLKR